MADRGSLLNSPDERPTWAEIDLDLLARNLHVVRARLGSTAILAVVKADAYGHGAVRVARRLEREGVEWLGVALPEEGATLRRAGARAPILVLGGFWPDQAALVLEHRLTPALFRPEQADALAAAAAGRSEPVAVHVKIDTGMGRLGVPASRIGAFADHLAGLRGLRVTGAFSHFAAADEPANPFTTGQIQTFLRAVAVLRDRGFAAETLHLANSPAILEHRASWMTLARPGLLLYGYHPDTPGPPLAVRPILSLRSRIVDLREAPAGASIGYGRTWTAAAPSRIATLALGYADGLPRAAGNRGEVLVRGRRARIVGRVSMDLTTVDVTAIPEAEVGDVATVIGFDEGQSAGADALAAACGTIAWEILARIGPRVPRRYRDTDGSPGAAGGAGRVE